MKTKRRYVSPEMKIVAIIHHRILTGSDPAKGLKVQKATGDSNEEIELGW